MSPKFYPSVMCMDYRVCLKECIADFEKAGVGGFHVDIMDGSFTNGVISAEILRRVRECTELPLGVHMMVRTPFNYLKQLYESRPETIYVHFEAENVVACLTDIRKQGFLAGLAVRPETSAEAITELLPMVDRVLLLRVTPGTTGQSPVPHVDEKMSLLLHTLDRNFDIVCDGAVSPEFVRTWLPHGVKHFVCGMASGLFECGADRRNAYDVLRERCGTVDITPHSQSEREIRKDANSSARSDTIIHKKHKSYLSTKLPTV